MKPDLASINLSRLGDYIRKAGHPVHINQLSRWAWDLWNRDRSNSRQFAPGEQYTAGEKILFNGRFATVVDVQAGQNSRQGKFQILSLSFSDGGTKQIAAAIPGAPTEKQIETSAIASQDQEFEDELAWRSAVQTRLDEDDRFQHFRDELGDQYCLVELLPELTEEEFTQLILAFKWQSKDKLLMLSAEALLSTIWDLEDDGQAEYKLYKFALNTSLQKYEEFLYLFGAGWVLSKQWQKFAKRKSLVGPRQPNVVPTEVSAIDESLDDDQGAMEKQDPDRQAAWEVDYETWRENRLNQTTFVLKAGHYYYHWLPLTKKLAQLFPPILCRLNVKFHFDGNIYNLQGYVNPEEGKVLFGREMYETFYKIGIYPGAKLIIKHRGSDFDYDMRTVPVEEGKKVLVRRLELEDGRLNYYDDEEPLRYQIEGDVFIAAARWEDLDALFFQAEQTGKGIFQLMFEKCKTWEQEKGSPVITTAEDLFAAIHYDPEGRLTNPATIAYELWQRRAFESLGNRRYQFHPEMGARRRGHGLTVRRRAPAAAKPKPIKKKLTPEQKGILSTPVSFTVDDLWHIVMVDNNKRLELKSAVSYYKSHPFREKILFLRQEAHARIRDLLQKNRLSDLTLEQFNHQVWQLGTVSYQGEKARIDKDEVAQLLQDMSMAEVKKAFQAGDLIIEGNQTWGSATANYGAMYSDLSDQEKLKRLIPSLQYLLYGSDDDETRIDQTLHEGNGLGINIVSGILHATNPARHILYNQRSVDMLQSLGIDWPGNWRKNVHAYLVYRDFMRRLRKHFSFKNFSDVDWFVYGWGNWQGHQEDDQTDRQQEDPPDEALKIGDQQGKRVKDVGRIGPLYDQEKETAPESPATGYFIFLKQPDSAYDDQVGRVFKYKQGAPGSKQVDIGARFIYYRTEEKHFFGSGRVDMVKRTQGEDGSYYYEAQIENFQSWKPPLPLNDALKKRVNFVGTKTDMIAQAGIRKISHEEFQTVQTAYEAMRAGKSLQEVLPVEQGITTLSPAQEFAQMQQLIRENLSGAIIYTVTGQPNLITAIDQAGLTVKTKHGEGVVNWIWIRQVYNKLRQLGEIDSKTIQRGEHRVGGGFRSSFIFGLLARFNYIGAYSRPRVHLVYQPQMEALRLEPGGFPAVEGEQEVIWTSEKIHTLLQNLNVQGADGQIDRRKPLLLLYALGQYNQGKNRLLFFRDIDRPLARIFKKFDPQSDGEDTATPFWNLQDDGLWALLDKKSLTDQGEPPSKDKLRQGYTRGGLPKGLFKAIKEDSRLGDKIVDYLLSAYFPLDNHVQICRSMGLSLPISSTADEAQPGEKQFPIANITPMREADDMSKSSKSLFAQHYLDFRIQEHEQWAADVSQSMTAVQALYAEKKALLPHYNEAQTENEFIQPLLELLGFAYTVQTSSRQRGQALRPDYALFADAQAKGDADQYLNQDEPFYSRAIAIGEAKYWQRPLTQQLAESGRGDFDNRNPSFQIVNYLTGTGVDWGILTNGRNWRLYYRQAGSTANEFYEVDLVQLLEENDPETFKKFWLFFRKEAFVPERGGRNFLAQVREGSTTYARAVSDTLKARVFEQVFPLLAGGFVADLARSGQNPDDPAVQALIKEATLSFLYKLLFLLYAEARELLPLDNDGYRRESVTQMVQEVARRIDRRETMGQTATTYYRRLLSLFEMIDRGDAAFGLPRYNGGLFHFDFRTESDRAKHKANYFLHQRAVNDQRLAQALDALARVDGQLVDYSFLEVRHLGAVYEGLLEYKLVIEDAATGALHLETDKGERRATGSYYTPDYIVKYIVQHTLDPILKERAERFKGLMADIVPKQERWAELVERLDGELTASVESRYRNELYLLGKELLGLEKEARETLLDIKVCDPAMGSGHFLVEAVDYLTDGLIMILNEHPDHNPILSQLAAIRNSILTNMAEQGITVEPGRLDDTQLLQRTVMKRCIYGVDINRMAVELAKLSLWLHSFTVGAPLSFLDHHLRWGNSLIGASAREAEQEMSAAGGGQMSLFGGPFKGLLRAAEVMRGISGLSDATLAEVEQSEALFQEFDKAAKPYKQLLDLHVAQHFGVKRAAEFLTLYGAEAIKAGPDSVGPIYAQTLHETEGLFNEKRFFHWELEFPEVFVDLEQTDWKLNPGFDAVIGNPPYITTGELKKNDINNWKYYKTFYQSASSGKYDLYLPFLEKAWQLINSIGYSSLILPNKWLKSDAGSEIRRLFSANRSVKEIIDFGSYQVFQNSFNSSGPTTYTCICCLGKSNFINLNYGRVNSFSHKLEKINKKSIPYEFLSETPWSIMSNFWSKLPKEIFQPLEKVANVFVGTTTNADSVFILEIVERKGEILNVYSDEERRIISIERQACIPFLRGKDISRYLIKNTDLVVIFPYRRDKETAELLPKSYMASNFPLTWSYLNRHKKKLENREEGKWIGREDWYCHAYPRNHSSIHWQKILTPDICNSGQFVLDYSGNYHILNTIYGISNSEFGLSLYYLLGIFNSKLFEAFIRNNSVDLRGGYYRVTKTFMSPFPIRVFVNKKDVNGFNFYSLEEFNDFVKLNNLNQIISEDNSSQFYNVENYSFGHELISLIVKKIIEMQKNSHTEIINFLEWLEEFTNLEINDWSLKTVANEYYKNDWKEFKRALNRNASAIERSSGVDVKSREGLGRIKREYEKSMAVLTPLMARIEATDQLIDQIVYKLYGLTEEEIAIVEGRA